MANLSQIVDLELLKVIDIWDKIMFSNFPMGHIIIVLILKIYLYGKTQDIGQEIKPENLKYLHQVEIVN